MHVTSVDALGLLGLGFDGLAVIRADILSSTTPSASGLASGWIATAHIGIVATAHQPAPAQTAGEALRTR